MAKTSLPALYSDDSRTGRDDLESQSVTETKTNTIIDISLPLVGLDSTGLGIPEGITATVQVDLSCSLLVTGDY